MEECLAIKPDLVFLWDEAWFAFAAFTPTYRQRTAMATAKKLIQKYRSAQYREEYQAQQQLLAKDHSTAKLLDTALLPDPDRVRIRVYATQSTHKSLTALRQGSMIHVFDQDFKQKVAEPFNEAFMTHTSTSPNYQIVASLDIGRRQVELEGYEMVQKQIELAMSIREQVATNPRLIRYFRFLVARDLVPAKYRQSGIEAYFDSETGWSNDHLEEAWGTDDFVVDPTRLTLYVGSTGIDGDTFKNEYLMDKYGIQINKTSRNTVLFMTNIGTSRSSVAFLIDVLNKIAGDLAQEQEEYGRSERKLFEKRVTSLTEDLPPLPDFSRFHDSFSPGKSTDTVEGDLRKAYFLAYEEDNCEYIEIDGHAIEEMIANGQELVSAGFVIPYPPGFPILVPGQVISADIITFMKKLDVKEIHGYRPELGLQIFTDEALKSVAGKN
jgi:arginine decarboxylase